MKKMSQTLANQIASQMCNESIDVTITTLKKTFADQATKLALDSFPKELVGCFHEYASYFRNSSTALFICDGMKNSAYMNKQIPSEYGSTPSISVTREQFDNLASQQTAISDLEEKRGTLYNKIYKTLLSLSTPKKIQEHFPEAMQYLPEEEEKTVTELTLPMSDIRDLLKKFTPTEQ